MKKLAALMIALLFGLSAAPAVFGGNITQEGKISAFTLLAKKDKKKKKKKKSENGPNFASPQKPLTTLV
jgi:hypothetical protein